MGWDEVQDGCQNWKILKFFNYDLTPNNDGHRFFFSFNAASIMGVCLEMNTLHDIKIQEATNE